MRSDATSYDLCDPKCTPEVFLSQLRRMMSERSTSYQLCNPKCKKTQYRGAIAVFESWTGITGPWREAGDLGGSATDASVMSNHSHEVRGIMTDKQGRQRPAVKRFKVFGLHEGFWEMERPQVWRGPLDGRYHLFFNCWARYVNPDWVKRHLKGSIKPTDDSLYHFVSSTPSGPFKPSETTPIVPGSQGTGLYGLRFADGTHLMGWHLEEFSLETGDGRWHLEWDPTGGEPAIRRYGR